MKCFIDLSVKIEKKNYSIRAKYLFPTPQKKQIEKELI